MRLEVVDPHREVISVGRIPMLIEQRTRMPRRTRALVNEDMNAIQLEQALPRFGNHRAEPEHHLVELSELTDPRREQSNLAKTHHFILDPRSAQRHGASAAEHRANTKQKHPAERHGAISVGCKRELHGNAT
jgi:hypothetical protein